MKTISEFDEIWLVDFEFRQQDGESPEPICLVAKEYYSGRVLRLWEDELTTLGSPPFSCAGDVLFVAYYASAEFGCHKALGWCLPINVLDLFAEFRNSTNGLTLPCGAGLLGAMAWYGLDTIEAVEKDSMRNLAIRGAPWTPEEKAALLDYCESDVVALEKLLTAMLDTLDLSRALLRGRYMKAAACMEFVGVPIDAQVFSSLAANWNDIQDGLIADIDSQYEVYDGRTFKVSLFENWLLERDIPWPRLPSGTLGLSDEVFKEMARQFPEIGPLRELRVILSQMRLIKLSVGSDGRNRCLLSAFRARTGRNQPSNSRFIFGPAVWLRSLIKPAAGMGLAYVDWSQQEFGIAAALSNDPLMLAAYASGDPYLEFAKQADAIPHNATRETHKAERAQFKACVLAVQYGMGAESLAFRIGQPVAQARRLLELHQLTYNVFWRWSDGALDYAMLHGKLWTTFGWTIHVGAGVNPRFLRNFLMQANGAEMLRLACCMATEAGVAVCAPVHDAILIEAPLATIDDQIAHIKALMAKASELVLDGFQLGTDVELIGYPDRYADDRGRTVWCAIQRILEEVQKDKAIPLVADMHTGETRHVLLTDSPPISLSNRERRDSD